MAKCAAVSRKRPDKLSQSYRFVAMAPRYLMYIAYIGKEFRGLQRLRGVKTIVGVIEDSLAGLKPANEVMVVTSSRTDKGVHALSNTVHIDLQHSEGGAEFIPDFLTGHVNNDMLIQNHHVRVMKTVRVRDDFHCRFDAIGRTYIYRVAVCQNTKRRQVVPFSPFDYARTHLVYKSFLDLDLVQRVAEMLSGTRDYRAFTRPRRLHQEPWINTVKTLQVSVQTGSAFLNSHLPHFYHEQFYNLEIVFQGSSFLYKQVLKMTAVMLAVGQGRLSLDQVRLMVDAPYAVQVLDTDIYQIPTHGLYMKEVLYNPEDLVYRPLDTSRKHEESDSKQTEDYDIVTADQS